MMSAGLSFGVQINDSVHLMAAALLNTMSPTITSYRYFSKFLFVYQSVDTASPSSLSIMRRDACVRIKSKKKL